MWDLNVDKFPQTNRVDGVWPIRADAAAVAVAAEIQSQFPLIRLSNS